MADSNWPYEGRGLLCSGLLEVFSAQLSAACWLCTWQQAPGLQQARPAGHLGKRASGRENIPCAGHREAAQEVALTKCTGGFYSMPKMIPGAGCAASTPSRGPLSQAKLLSQSRAQNASPMALAAASPLSLPCLGKVNAKALQE